jgi:MFS family permease
MSATSLNDNIYVAFILSAIVELPAYFLTILLMDHWGRKPTLIFLLFVSGICCIPAGFASGTLQTVLVLIGTHFTVMLELAVLQITLTIIITFINNTLETV